MTKWNEYLRRSVAAVFGDMASRVGDAGPQRPYVRAAGAGVARAAAREALRPAVALQQGEPSRQYLRQVNRKAWKAMFKDQKGAKMKRRAAFNEARNG